MLTIYETSSGGLERQTGQPRITEQAIWVDLLNPTPEEETQVERALKIDVPTREEQQEIEVSSRLYQENGAHFMTATLIYQPDRRRAANDARHLHPRRPAPRHAALCRAARLRHLSWRAATGPKPISRAAPPVLIGLIETIVDRLADFIERIQAEVEALSHSIFEIKGGAASRQRRFDVCCGRSGARARSPRRRAKARIRSAGCSPFSRMPPTSGKRTSRCKARIRTAARDVAR